MSRWPWSKPKAQASAAAQAAPAPESVDAALQRFRRDLAALGAGEATSLRARGLPVAGVAGREHLKQPCAALDAFTCTAYDVRPAACRAYRCGLLRGVEDGTIEPASAVSLVRSQRGLVARLVEATGTGTFLETLRTLEAQGDDSAGELARSLTRR